jgi:hypothetical protein
VEHPLGEHLVVVEVNRASADLAADHLQSPLCAEVEINLAAEILVEPDRDLRMPGRHIEPNDPKNPDRGPFATSVSSGRQP